MLSLMKSAVKARCTTEGDSRRSFTYTYFLLNEDGQRRQVWQKMFLGTLGLNEKMVREWRNSSEKFSMLMSPIAMKEKSKSNNSAKAHAIASK